MVRESLSAALCSEAIHRTEMATLKKIERVVISRMV